jgi:hypothetical protein
VLLEEAESEASGDVEKGYFHTTGLFAGKRIQLSFAANVSLAWKTALNAAKTEWNNKTPMFARDPGGAATISVVLEAFKKSNGTPETNAIAAGAIPSFPRIIKLNSNFAQASCGGSLEGIPANAKINQALHEMGHVLGFAHPPPNPSAQARTHIAGTAVSTGSVSPSYATVMDQGCNTRTALTADDVLSATKKYPSCITTCENNCLGSIDPAAIGLCMSSCPRECGG